MTLAMPNGLAMRLTSRWPDPVVGGAVAPSGHGYWLVASDGGIFTYGSARFHGSMGATHINQPVFSMAPTKSGNGYWLVAHDGGIFYVRRRALLRIDRCDHD